MAADNGFAMGPYPPRRSVSRVLRIWRMMLRCSDWLRRANSTAQGRARSG
jgi:hypothetical protein